jgi:hypothetical protein
MFPVLLRGMGREGCTMRGLGLWMSEGAVRRGIEESSVSYASKGTLSATVVGDSPCIGDCTDNADNGTNLV